MAQTPPVPLDRPEAFTTPPTSRRPAQRVAPPLEVEVDDDFAAFHSNFHSPGSARKVRAPFSDADDDMAAFAAAFHSPGSKARTPEYAVGVSPLVRSMSQVHPFLAPDPTRPPLRVHVGYLAVWP